MNTRTSILSQSRRLPPLSGGEWQQICLSGSSISDWDKRSARMRSDSVKNMSAYADQNHAPSLAAARLEFNLTKNEPEKVQIRSLYFFWFGQFLLLKVKHRMFIFLFFLVLDILLPVYLQLRMPLPVFRMENP